MSGTRQKAYLPFSGSSPTSVFPVMVSSARAEALVHMERHLSCRGVRRVHRASSDQFVTFNQRESPYMLLL